MIIPECPRCGSTRLHYFESNDQDDTPEPINGWQCDSCAWLMSDAEHDELILALVDASETDE